MKPDGGSKSHEICNLAYIFDYILNIVDGVLTQLEVLPEKFGPDYNLEGFSSIPPWTKISVAVLGSVTFFPPTSSFWRSNKDLLHFSWTNTFQMCTSSWQHSKLNLFNQERGVSKALADVWPCERFWEVLEIAIWGNMEMKTKKRRYYHPSRWFSWENEDLCCSRT